MNLQVSVQDQLKLSLIGLAGAAETSKRLVLRLVKRTRAVRTISAPLELSKSTRTSRAKDGRTYGPGTDRFCRWG